MLPKLYKIFEVYEAQIYSRFITFLLEMIKAVNFS